LITIIVQYILCNIYIFYNFDVLCFTCGLHEESLVILSCANTFEILEIPQENFVGPSNPRSHRVQRNFRRVHGFPFICVSFIRRTVVAEMNSRNGIRERNVRTEIAGQTVDIKPSSIFLIFAIS